MLFELNSFHGDLHSCVQYSNVKYQDEIFKTYH